MADDDQHALSIPTSSPPHFFNLPQELQDMIFEFAYYRESSTDLLGKKEWYARKFRRRPGKDTDAFVPQPYPGPKVSEFLISKRWFVAAAEAYVRSQKVFLSRKIQGQSTEPFWTEGIVTAFARDVEADFYSCRFLFRMADLRNLCVTPNSAGIADAISDENHDHEHEILPFRERELTVAELARTHLARSLQQVRGLAHLTVVCSELDDLVGNDKQSQMWRRNVENLMAMMRMKNVSPRTWDTSAENEDSCDDFWPLYPGSRVGFGASTLRDSVSSRQLTLGLESLADRIVFSKKPLPKQLEQKILALLDFEPDGDPTWGVALESFGEVSTIYQTVRPEEHADEKLRLTEEKLT